MTNHLARVVMNNISKKTQKWEKCNSYGNYNKNLTLKDEEVLRSIIHKDNTLKVSTANKKMVTLEELSQIVSRQYER